MFYRHPLHIYLIEALAAKPDQYAERVGGHDRRRGTAARLSSALVISYDTNCQIKS